MVNLHGIRIYRNGNTIFIPLPSELWSSCNGCSCQYCSTNSAEINLTACWDTLSVYSDPDYHDHAWLVHAPEFHGVKPKR